MPAVRPEVLPGDTTKVARSLLPPHSTPVTMAEPRLVVLPSDAVADGAVTCSTNGDDSSIGALPGPANHTPVSPTRALAWL